jgi:hypothetical protein
VKHLVTAALALALCLVGCGRGEQVPLITVETVVGHGGCVLLYQVVDVIADPASGTPAIKGGGEPLRWPSGYTARRSGFEVEVLDPTGTVVLTTGHRYWMCPEEYLPNWVIGEVRPCPRQDAKADVPDTRGWYDCALGHGVL